MKVSISRDGKEIGEWTEEEIRIFYAEGRLVATDYFWKEGMPTWASLASFIKPPPPSASLEAQYRQPIHSILAEQSDPDHTDDEIDQYFYKVAHYQHWLGVCFFGLIGALVLFEIGSIYHYIILLFLCDSLMLPAVIYGGYCFVRYQAELYGWWKALTICGVVLFIPFLILLRIYMSYRKFSRELEEAQLELNWKGQLQRKPSDIEIP